MNLNGLASPAAAALGGTQQFASPIGQDRIIRKEISLGMIREIVPPMTHIGLQLFPFLPVDSDDVIFQYALGDADGLAPARAEDAESELARKDDTFLSEGRASVIDWAIKDHYAASDVSRYREFITIMEAMRDTKTLALTAAGYTDGFTARLARDAMRRRHKLDNRIEWLIMSALSTGSISYNDGKIVFSVNYGRPAGQQLVLGTNATVNGDSNYPLGAVWSAGTNSDPINDIISIQQFMYDTYGVRVTRAIASRKALNYIMRSDKFAARSGLITQSGSTKVDPNYLVDGWGPIAAQRLVEQATGLSFIEYDSVYRTRAFGSTSFVATRFLPQNRIIFLADEGDVAEFDETQIGMGKVLTSPHPAGNWTSGYYEWEKEFGVDPWGYDVGTGIKAFPVFPHMDLTVGLDVY